ncbi:MAG TPA: DUF2975 domain-containing protein [Bacillota bacterium]|nr:DUF2975 domain-containing protein [Bacillota bacterium]HOL02226.1 DUF2975 domain-containing protein [Bacillota bacterium]HPO80895.1 DUF2975 domain-containing protein [Bacillota bacterium]
MRYLGKKSVASWIHRVLGFLWYAFWVIGILLAGWQLFTGIFPEKSLTNLPPASLQIQTPGLDIKFEGVTAAIVSQRFLWLTLFSTVVVFAVYLYVLYNLRRVFATLVAGNPFARENVSSIRRIGGAVITGAVVRSLVQTAFGLFFAQNVAIPGVDFTAKLTLDFVTLFLGFVILVLAEIFRMGSELKEEQDLTV